MKACKITAISCIEEVSANRATVGRDFAGSGLSSLEMKFISGILVETPFVDFCLVAVLAMSSGEVMAI